MTDSLFRYTPEEMRRLVLRIHPRMTAYIRRLLGRGSRQDAEDILQNALEKFLRKKAPILKEKVDGYLFRIIRNDCLNVISRHSAALHPIRLDDSATQAWETLAAADFDPAPAEDLPTVDELFRYAEGFSPRTRDIFFLSRVEGKTHKEIASELGISERAVEKHLKNTVIAFRDHFKN